MRSCCLGLQKELKKSISYDACIFLPVPDTGGASILSGKDLHLGILFAKAKWSELGNVKTWVYALGQVIFFAFH